MLGADAVTASALVGIPLYLAALVGTALVLQRRTGTLAGLAFVALASMETHVMHHATSGLESPLTLGLLAIALGLLMERPRSVLVGAVAGLLAVHKLDLLPAALLLLWVQGRLARSRPGTVVARSGAVAAAIAAAWYLFALLHFGSALPNSFVTKLLHQGHLPTQLDGRWFPELVFRASFHPWLTLFAVAAAFRGPREVRGALHFLGGLVAAHVATYAALPPFEPYVWYAVPSIFALLVAAAIGLATIGRLVADALPSRRVPPAAVAAPILGALVASYSGIEEARTAQLVAYLQSVEHDRAAAGRWVAATTPPGATLLTSWGNPAYHSHRRVVDVSFLNRPYEPGTLQELVGRHRPDAIVVVSSPVPAGATPRFPRFGDDYEVVQVFESGHLVEGRFYAVLARRPSVPPQ